MKRYLFLLILLTVLLPAFCGAAKGDVVINEIAWMGTKASANDEWIELHNTTDADINLSGWKLTSADGKIKTSLKGFIIAKGFYLLERTDDATLPGLPADLIYTGALANTGKNLVLSDKSGAQVDQISVQDRWQAGNNDTKATMEKISTGWHTSSSPGGTPKATNSQGIIKTANATLPTIQKTDTTNLSALSQPLGGKAPSSPWLLLFVALGITALCAGLVLFVKFKSSKNHVRP